MANSSSGAAASTKKVYSETNGKEHQGTTSRKNGTVTGEYSDMLVQAKQWVEENQAAAMLSGFGFGVFIGVLLRR